MCPMGLASSMSLKTKSKRGWILKTLWGQKYTNASSERLKYAFEYDIAGARRCCGRPVSVIWDSGASGGPYQIPWPGRIQWQGGKVIFRCDVKAAHACKEDIRVVNKTLWMQLYNAKWSFWGTRLKKSWHRNWSNNVREISNMNIEMWCSVTYVVTIMWSQV